MRPAQNSSRSASLLADAAATIAPCRAAIASTASMQMVDLGRAAVELDDQQRLDVERIAGMDEGLGGVDRRPVHHLHAAGDDAGGDDRGDAVAGALDRWGSRSAARAPPGGFGRMRTVTSVTTPSSPSEPTMTPEQVVAFGIEVLAAEPDDLAVDRAPSRCRGRCWW